MKHVIQKRKEAERQGRIDQILRAARTIFLQKGYWGTTIRDIANKAALSTGAIYFYFTGKDEIYGKICHDIMQLTIKLLNKNRNPSGSMNDRLTAIMDAYVGFYVNHKEDFDLLDTAYKQVALPDHLNIEIDALVLEALSYVNEIFKDAAKFGEISTDADTWQLTMNIWAAIEGILYIHKRKFLEGVPLDLDHMIREQLSLFVNGIRVAYSPPKGETI